VLNHDRGKKRKEDGRQGVYQGSKPVVRFEGGFQKKRENRASQPQPNNVRNTPTKKRAGVRFGTAEPRKFSDFHFSNSVGRTRKRPAKKKHEEQARGEREEPGCSSRGENRKKRANCPTKGEAFALLTKHSKNKERAC